MTVEVLTWREVAIAAQVLAENAPPDATGVYGVPRGGVPVAIMVAFITGLPLLDSPEDGMTGAWVVDDLVDSGATLSRYRDQGYRTGALFAKSHSPAWAVAPERDGWLVFPWEGNDEQAGPADAVVRLLQHVGEDPWRDGLIDTPGRVLRSLSEMTAGYGEDPATILGTTFDVAYDELVVVSGIEFTSLCEHHMLPFVGTATVGYLPGKRVVGLSKIARLVECFARRLQVQERMTQQIAHALDDVLQPQSVGVVLKAQHECMACRGVRKRASMVTSAMLGGLRDKPEQRAEFMALAEVR